MNKQSGLILVLACVVVLGLLVTRQSIGQRDAPPAVQRWEYKVVDISGAAAAGISDGTKGITDALEKQFNAIGDEGWSLVNMPQGAAVFKRPK